MEQHLCRPSYWHLHLTRHYPGGHRGRYWRFSLTDPCQEGEEEAIPSHGEDDPRQGEHGAQQAGSTSGMTVVGEGGRGEKVRTQVSWRYRMWLSREQHLFRASLQKWSYRET